MADSGASTRHQQKAVETKAMPRLVAMVANDRGGDLRAHSASGI